MFCAVFKTVSYHLLKWIWIFLACDHFWNTSTTEIVYARPDCCRYPQAYIMSQYSVLKEL